MKNFSNQNNLRFIFRYILLGKLDCLRLRNDAQKIVLYGITLKKNGIKA